MANFIIRSQQSVEVSARVGDSVRASQEPKALAMFCVAHARPRVEMMSEGQLEGRNLAHSELTEWTDANAEELFKAVDGDGARDMLQHWEQANLGGPEQLATSDWPGWRVAFKRLAH